MTKRKTKKKTRNKKRKKNKFLQVILSALIIFSVIFIGIFLLFLHWIFGPDEKYSAEPLSISGIYHQNQIISRLSQILFKSKPDQLCVLKLSENEVNSVIATISNSDSVKDFLFSASKIGQPPRKRPYKISFKDNMFHVQYSYPTEYSTPFGGNINIKVSGIPMIDNKGIHIKIKSAFAGDLPLPPDRVENLLSNYLSANSNEDIKRFLEVVKKAYITQQNEIVIYFYPYRIKTFI